MKKNNKKTVTRSVNRSKKSGSVARNVLATEVANVRYSQSKLLTKAAGIEVPGADDISIVASTIQTDEDGRVKNTWTRRVRSQAARQEMFLQAVKAVTSRLTRPARIKAPKRLNKDLLALYPLGDPPRWYVCVGGRNGHCLRSRDCREDHEGRDRRPGGPCTGCRDRSTRRLG